MPVPKKSEARTTREASEKTASDTSVSARDASVEDGIAIGPAEVRKVIETALARHAEEDAQRIQIQVSGGKVTLSGSVPSWSEKRALVGAVAHAKGVRRVHDQVKVVYT